ncbi:MAG: hypothetical protein WC449_04940 [Candidatus Paceibacterota bacterium]
MENKVVESSVQVKDRNYWNSTIFRMAAQYDITPTWWTPSRDAFFRGYWYQEDFLASAIYAIANRNAAFGWQLTGLDDDVKRAQQLLQFAEFGEGWQQLIIKTSTDLLTQDNGAFIEVIRPARVRIDGKSLPAVKEYYESDNAEWFAFDGGKRIAAKGYDVYDSPLDLPIGIAHLDSGQCQRTGDPETPVLYTDRNGKKHALKWWQVLMFNEMPSPIEKMNGVGMCAVSRLFRSSHIMQSISLYNDEKISGRFNRAVFLTNVDPDTINDAIALAENDADNKGLIRYSQPIVAATLDPTSQVSLETINLAEIPDNFNFNDVQNWYIANLALALGVDYGFLAPLPGKGLGSASQSETMERQSRGKSSRLFMDMISNAVNFKGILPESVQFEFIEKDSEEDARIEKVRMDRAKRYQVYGEMGWITPTVAQQMLADEGDIPEVYVEQMGQEDTTPVTTTEGDENVEATEEQAEGIEESEQVKERQKQLFKRPSLVKRIKNVTAKIFKKKQVEAPEVDNQSLQEALDNYSEELETLTLRANNGELTQAEFENQLSNMVTLSLMAIYSQMVGKDPEDFTEEEQDRLDEYVNVNLESVGQLADDIYSDKYQDTEDRDGTAMLLVRMGLWVMNAYALATLGMLNNPSNQENKLRWNLGTAEHCSTCLALDGQIHTVSEWNDSGFYPGNTSLLLCNGFNCACRFSDVSPSTPSQGSFNSVPTK